MAALENLKKKKEKEEHTNVNPKKETDFGVGLYTMLPLAIVYGIYCNKGGRGGGGTIYCAIVWAMRGCEGGAQTRELFANNSIDLCTKASS